MTAAARRFVLQGRWRKRREAVKIFEPSRAGPVDLHSVLSMGKDNIENKWLAALTVGARLAAPFGRWARQAAPLHRIFILRDVARRHDRLSEAKNLRVSLRTNFAKQLLFVEKKRTGFLALLGMTSLADFFDGF